MTLRHCWVIVALPVMLVGMGWERALGQSSSRVKAEAPLKPEGVVAPALQPTVAAPSPHFERVMKRLDVGGKMLQFRDHEGTRELAIELGEALIGAVPELGAGAKDIDVGSLVDAVGMGNTLASGRSLRRDGESWLLRTYSYAPKGRSVFAKMLGEEAIAFRAPSVLPAATDLVVEARYGQPDFPDMVMRLAKVLGQEAAAQAWMDEEMPHGESAAEFMRKLDLHIMAGVDVSYWKLTKTPVDFYVEISGQEGFLDAWLPGLEESLGKPKAIGVRQGWEFSLPPFLGQPKAKGLLMLARDGRLIAVSRKAYLDFVESDSLKLEGEKDFQAATKQFPTNGNLMVYGSRQLPHAIGRVIRMASSQMDPPTNAIMSKVAEFLKPQPVSYCVAHEVGGTITMGRIPFAFDLNPSVTLPVLSGTSVLFVGARAWKKGSDRARCILNIRNVQQGVRSHQNMFARKIGAPIDWSELIGPDSFVERQPVCPAGGTYTFAEVVPEIGELACRCSHERAENHVPDHHGDW